MRKNFKTHNSLQRRISQENAQTLKLTRTLVTKAAALFGAIALFFFGVSTNAMAHDVLVDQVPADGAVLDAAPEEVRLSFNNNLIDIGEGATVINIIDASGNVVVDDVPSISGMDAFQPISDLTEGAYLVVWRVVSSDGHPISGSSTFAFGPDAEALLEELPTIEEALGGTPADSADAASGGDSNAEEDAAGPDSAAGPNSQNSSAGISVPLVITLIVGGILVIAVVILLLSRKKK